MEYKDLIPNVMVQDVNKTVNFYKTVPVLM
jgi:hypothetical protein